MNEELQTLALLDTVFSSVKCELPSFNYKTVLFTPDFYSENLKSRMFNSKRNDNPLTSRFKILSRQNISGFKIKYVGESIYIKMF
jgi:hypothetical protein